MRPCGLTPKPILKADRDTGIIRIDSETTLTGVPGEAWAYRLGNRSALDWILDQYKEKTPRDPTIDDLLLVVGEAVGVEPFSNTC